MVPGAGATAANGGWPPTASLGRADPGQRDGEVGSGRSAGRIARQRGQHQRDQRGRHPAQVRLAVHYPVEDRLERPRPERRPASGGVRQGRAPGVNVRGRDRSAFPR